MDVEIPYNHYHLEIIATDDQVNQLKDLLYARGLAIDFMPFDLKTFKESTMFEQCNNEIENAPIATNGIYFFFSFLFFFFFFYKGPKN